MSKMKILGAAMSLVQCKDRWYNVAYYLRTLPPWAKERMGWAGLSGKQVIAASNFASIQTSLNDAGMTRWQRRESTAKILRGKDYGGIKRPAKRSPISKTQLDSAIATATALIRTA